MNICVFCSSSNHVDRCYIAAAQETGRAIAERGHTLIFGGYDMGLMGEVAKATVSAGGKVIGVTTSGLSAKGRSVVPGIQELQTENLSKRKETMVSLSDAFITMPGRHRHLRRVLQRNIASKSWRDSRQKRPFKCRRVFRSPGANAGRFLREGAKFNRLERVR